MDTCYFVLYRTYLSLQKRKALALKNKSYGSRWPDVDASAVDDLAAAFEDFDDDELAAQLESFDI